MTPLSSTFSKPQLPPQDSSLSSTIVAAVYAGGVGIISCGWFPLVVRSADATKWCGNYLAVVVGSR